MNSSLRAFLEKKCAGKCVKTLTGPTISNWSARITPLAGGGFNCVLGVTIDARIDCKEPEAGPAIDAGWPQMNEGFAALMKETEPLDGPRRG